MLVVVGIAMVNAATPKDRFDRWFDEVLVIAPRYHLSVKDDAAWREWFWLYYYEGGVSPKNAVRGTKRYDNSVKKGYNTK